MEVNAWVPDVVVDMCLAVKKIEKLSIWIEVVCEIINKRSITPVIESYCWILQFISCDKLGRNGDS